MYKEDTEWKIKVSMCLQQHWGNCKKWKDIAMASHSSRTRVCDTHEREYVTWGHAALHIWSREAGSTKRKSFNTTSSLGCVEKGWWDRFQVEHGGHASRFLRRCGKRDEISKLPRISREQGIRITRKDSSFVAYSSLVDIDFLCMY